MERTVDRYLPFRRRCGLQMNGLEAGVGHKDALDGLPPDCVCGSGFQELAFGDGELLIDVVTGRLF